MKLNMLSEIRPVSPISPSGNDHRNEQYQKRKRKSDDPDRTCYKCKYFDKDIVELNNNEYSANTTCKIKNQVTKKHGKENYIEWINNSYDKNECSFFKSKT